MEQRLRALEKRLDLLQSMHLNAQKDMAKLRLERIPEEIRSMLDALAARVGGVDAANEGLADRLKALEGIEGGAVGRRVDALQARMDLVSSKAEEAADAASQARGVARTVSDRVDALEAPRPSLWSRLLGRRD